MLFRYVTRIMHVSIAGRALAGWSFPDKECHGPDITAFLHEGNMDKFESFAKTLFRKIDLPDLHSISRLIEFRNGMIGSFLMHMKDFESSAPENDPIMKHVMKCADENGIKKKELLEWGKEIRLRFDAQNSASQVSPETPEAMITMVNTMAKNVIELQEQSKRQHVEQLKEIKLLRNEIQE